VARTPAAPSFSIPVGAGRLRGREVELTDPDVASLTDTVLNVRQGRGGLVIRPTRLTITTALTENGATGISEGSVVGLPAASYDVHIFHSGS
jgi:hypothetical protein